MQFNTLISQVSNLQQPKIEIPVLENIRLLYDYTLMQFVKETSPNIYIPYNPPEFDGLGKVTLVTNWGDGTIDGAEVGIKLKVTIKDLPETIYEIDENFIINIPKEFNILFSGFKVEVKSFTAQPSYPAPTDNILKIDIAIQRCQTFIEIY